MNRIREGSFTEEKPLEKLQVTFLQDELYMLTENDNSLF